MSPASTAGSASGEPSSLGPAPASGYPVELQRAIEDYLGGLRFGVEAGAGRLEEAMRYSLLGGGKRIRPVLALASAEALGRDPAEVLPFAAAIEMVHTYSLIHDDLPAMDDDALRRGKPTCHVAFGDDVAILAGDGLFAEAIRLICEEQRDDPARVLAALAELTAATGADGMVGGQYLDVVAHAPGASDRSSDPAIPLDTAEQSLRQIHGRKTGRLIRASVLAPLLLCGATEAAKAPYARFADELGMLFQIVDDILDVAGTDEQLGKPRGSDERHGKLTYVSLLGLERARELAASFHGRARAALAEADGQTADLELICDFIHSRRR